MRGKAKRSSALTSAVAAVSALVLAAGLSLPTTLAFAGGDAADPERPAGDVNDVLLDEGEADQAAEVAEDGTQDAATVETASVEEEPTEASMSEQAPDVPAQEGAASGETAGSATEGQEGVAEQPDIPSLIAFNWASNPVTGRCDFTIDLRDGGANSVPLTYTTNGADVDYTLSWRFMDEGVAEIIDGGNTLAGLSCGYTYFFVRATAVDDPSNYHEITGTVTVIGNDTPSLDSFSIDVDGSQSVAIDYIEAPSISLNAPEGASFTVAFDTTDDQVAYGYYDDLNRSATLIPRGVGTCTVTATATDDLDPSRTMTSSIEVTVVNEQIPLHPNPWAEDGRSLLPHTIENGVMTFDDDPDGLLGEWYRLGIETGEGVVCSGSVSGSGYWAMTVPAAYLDEDDPDYAPNSYTGPYYIRGNHGGMASHISFYCPDGTDPLLEATLEPASAGTVAQAQPGVWMVQLNAPATLKVSKVAEGDTATVTVPNEQGASLSVEVADQEELQEWSSLGLVTDPLSDDVAQKAQEAVAIAFGNATYMQALDIHLVDARGDETAIPGGKTVTVTLPIPEGWATDGLRVLHVSDDGTVTDMNAVVDAQARTVSFATNHFSTFVLASYAQQGGGGAGSPAGGGDPSITVPDGQNGPTGDPDGGQTTDDTVKPLTTDDASGLAKTGDSPVPLAAVAAVAALAAVGAAGIALRRRG